MSSTAHMPHTDVVEGFLPSSQQRRLWHAQRELDAHPFTTVARLRVDGRLDRERLARALRALVNRHDIFRTTYEPTDDAPLQIIQPATAETRGQVDRLAETQDPGQGRVSSAAQATAFDLRRGPMLRASVLGVAPDRHLVSLTFPAIAGDVKTAEIVAACLARAYEANGVLHDDGDLQYLQYSEYQHEWLNGDEARDLRERWAGLARDAAPPALTGLRPVSSSTRFRIDACPIELGDEAIVRLRTRCEEAGANLESGLATLWHALIARFTGQSRFRLAYEADGRTFDELARLPGALARSVPWDVELDLGRSFADHVAATHQRLAELGACQDGCLASDCTESDTTVGFSFASLDRSYDTGDCRIALDAAWSCPERFATRLNAVAIGERLELMVEHDEARFEADLASQLAESYAVLARSVIEQPSLALGLAPLLSSARRHEMVAAWNETAAASRDDRLVYERIEAIARQHPDADAIQMGSETVTSAELDAYASRVSAYLRARGARPDAVVAVVATPSIEVIAAILGILKSGAAYLPIDPALPAARIAFMLRDAGALAVLSTQELDDQWAAEVPHRLMVTRAWLQDDARREPGDGAIEPTPEHAAYVIYTSGSTGTPKGVVVPHRALANYLDWCGRAYAAASTDHGKATPGGAPLHTSLAFDLSVTSLLGPLVMGRPISVAPADGRVEGLTNLLRTRGDFAWIKVTPGHARLLGERLTASGVSGRTRTLIVGGEALTEADVRVWRLGAPDTVIVNEYGPTEATVGCATHLLESVTHPGAAHATAEPVPIGRPIHHTRLYVLDEALNPVPPGVIGELFIGGDCLARGYLGRPDLTAERFVPDPFGTDARGGRLYRTGDLARSRRDGVFLYHGRRDDQVKVRGYRVELGEIDAVLVQHPAVREAVVVARGVDQDGPRLVAYLTIAPQGDRGPTVADLREFLAARLPEYMVPAMFVVLPELPLTRHGKVDRRALPEPNAMESGRTYVGPRTLEEEVLAEIWAKVLGLARVGIDDDYFALGGDSIRAIQVAGLAGQRGLDVTIDRLFRHRTVRALAASLRLGAGTEPLSRVTEPFALVSAADRARMREDVVDAYPLSALQAGMVFHRAYHPGSAIYHDIFGYHLRMPLDVSKLEQAVRALVERHPALRTAFHIDEFSEPLQLVYRDAPLPLEVTDIRHHPVEEQERMLHEWMALEKQRGFADRQRPMLRFHVYIRSAETFELFLSFHHAVLDGWSDANMLLELAVSYQALLDGQPIPFTAPETRYREFIALERQVRQSEEARRFWAEKLSGCRPLVLPRWRAAPAAEEGTRGVKVQRVPIPRETSVALRRLARSLAVPFKSVLLAVHMRVLSALSGTTDVLSSLSVAGRPETPDANQVLGLHITSAPIRMHLTGGTWTELIHRAFREECEALPHRRYPLPEIQRITGIRRLVETSFYYTHYHNIEPLARLPQFEILDRLIYEETSFGMVANFNLDPFHDLLGLTLACDQTQFERDQREWIGHYYERALSALAADPAARYDGLDLMTGEERARIVAFNESPTGAAPWGFVQDTIAAEAGRVPDRDAVVCGDTRLTYAELNARADHLAACLRARGAGPDRIIGLSAERSVELVVGILGILKAGAAYLPLDPAYPRERLQFMVEDAQPLAVVVSPRSVETARTMNVPLLNIASLSEQDEANDQDHPSTGAASALRPDNLAYMIYTSGSSGRPKGTLVTHANLAHSTAARLAYYREPVGAYLLLSSYAFDSSVAGLFWTLVCGGTLVLPPEEALRDPDAILDLLDRHHVSHALMLPSLYGAVLEAADGRAPRHLDTAIVAGEACQPQVVARHLSVWPRVQLFNEYGPTEATVWSTVEACRPLPEGEAVPIGRSIPGTHAYVLDGHGHLAPLGTPGELYVGGPGVTRGYLAQPDLTAAAFVPDGVGADPGGRLYRTGDRCRYRHDGTIEFLGRLDHQVKIRGHRVEIEEIEAALQADVEIDEAAVVAREEVAGDVRLSAYLVAPRMGLARRQGLDETLRPHLPASMIPSRILFVDALPRTPNGKLDRRALADLGGASEDSGERYVPPADPMQAALADIWAQVLKRDRVGIEDDFFAIGGDSIMSIQIIARAKTAGLRVSPADLFQCRTIAALSPRVRHIDQPGPPATADVLEGADGIISVGVSDAQVAELVDHLRQSPSAPEKS